MRTPNGAIFLASLIAAIAGETALAQNPVGVGFTYQGRLSQNGQPLSGNVNLTFELYDDQAGGNLLGSQTLADTPVSGGLFSVLLNDADQFGAGVFNGSRRWLQVTVGDALIETRQELTAAPYALFALRPWSTENGLLSYNAGNVGIGTTTPEQPLSVAGVIQSLAGGFKFPDGTVQASAATGGGGFWSSSGTSIFSNNAGSVGIGTNAPASKLDIAAAGEGAELLRFSTERPWIFRQIYTGPSTGLQLFSTSGLKNFEITAANGVNVATFLTDTANPRVGIGTTSPLSRLDIAASGDGAELLRFSTERPWIFRQIYTGPSTGLQLYSTSGLKNFEITAANGANVATFLTDTANPRVGIGTNSFSTASRLEIAAQDALTIVGYQPFLTLKDTNSNMRSRIQTVNGEMYFYPESAFATGDPALKVLNSGRTSVKTLEIRGGADLAEPFDMAGDVGQPGTVVVIDPQNPGRLKPCTQGYDPKVAGIISGAGGVATGLSMGHEGTVASGQHPVALTGRVYCMVDATDAPIEPGDMLTTSATPGHAMKASNRDKAFGSVLGKAMQPLSSGRGLILVLVSLQ